MKDCRQHIGASFALLIGDPNPNCIKIPDAFFNSRTCNRKELLTFSVGGANFSVIMERDSAGSYKIKADGCASFFQSIGIKSYDLLVLKYMGKLEFEVSTLCSNMFDVSHMWIGGDQFCRTEAKNEIVFGPSSKYVFAMRIEDAEAPRKILPTVFAETLFGKGPIQCNLLVYKETCKVQIERNTEFKSYVFGNGWKNFVRKFAYAKTGDLLIFKHMGHYTFDVDVMSPNECLEYNYLYFHLRGFQPLLEIDEDKIFFKVMMSGRMGDRMVMPDTFVEAGSLKKFDELWLSCSRGHMINVKLFHEDGITFWKDQSWIKFQASNSLQRGDTVTFTLDKTASDETNIYLNVSWKGYYDSD